MAIKIARVQSKNTELNQVQDNIQRALAPLLGNQVLLGVLLAGIVLKAGVNSVNHTLGRKLTGWTIVRQRAEAQLWDTQDSNPTPNLTLSLNSTAAVTVDLYVF